MHDFVSKFKELISYSFIMPYELFVFLFYVNDFPQNSLKHYKFYASDVEMISDDRPNDRLIVEYQFDYKVLLQDMLSSRTMVALMRQLGYIR